MLYFNKRILCNSLSPIIFTAIFFLSCGKDNGLGSNDPVDPADADALSSVVILPNGTETRQGTPPDPTNSSTAPNIRGGVSRLTSSNGSTVLIPFSYDASADISGYYLYINGAENHFYVPYRAQSSNTTGPRPIHRAARPVSQVGKTHAQSPLSGTFSIPIGLPTNVTAGQFCTSANLTDSRGEISNTLETCIDVLALGSGILQVSLSWDNTADVDIWVTDTSGTKIYFANPSSATGGSLDRDDVNGYGPENIFWENAPDGSYLVEVNHYAGARPSGYIVTINGLGTSPRQFQGILTGRKQTNFITRISKSGNRITFNAN